MLELSQQGKEEIKWDDLSKAYLENYLERLRHNKMPQQSNPHRMTKMERIVTAFEKDQISKAEAIARVSSEGFNDVIPRFQTIGANKEIVGERFYHFDFGKKLYLHDSTFQIAEDSKEELFQELDARWSLLEGAFSLTRGDWQLSNDIREVYIENGYERTSLTPSIPFLQGNQGNICFYCGEPVKDDDIHVDHLLPRQVIMNDEIWNLVLSHSDCNLNKSDALVGKHYFEKLIARNENIMGINHPWKKKISDALGKTKNARAKALWAHYENTRIVLRSNYWEGSPTYNRETDPFFKRLITTLNNG